MTGSDEQHHDELRFDTLPNRLTLLRMILVPLVVGLLFIQKPSWDIVAALCFALAGVTDWLDGYFARKRGVVTVYGKLLDPLADKFLVVCSLIALQYLRRVPPIIVMILVCRELGITGLRALASAEGVIIAASGGGKWKTASQMLAIPFIMVKPGLFGIPLFHIGLVLLYISVAMSLWSAKDYVIDFFKALREQRKHRSHERKLARQARLATRAARLAEKAMRKPKLPPAQHP